MWHKRPVIYVESNTKIMYTDNLLFYFQRYLWFIG